MYKELFTVISSTQTKKFNAGDIVFSNFERKVIKFRTSPVKAECKHVSLILYLIEHMIQSRCLFDS